jgi:acyl-CoA dehydrogenase
MSWSFETEPEFQRELDWVDAFVTDEIEPLDFIIGHPNDFSDPNRRKLIPPLQAEVKKRGLWACHLGPELGGQGYGQVKLALMTEILGRAKCAPTVFGCQAPDSGNAEILAHYGTTAQKAKYLQPLLNSEICSCYSMTEPQGGADPKVFTCLAEADGDNWVINGEKWFSSNARYASFLIVMAVTDPDAPAYQRMSMFIVPSDTPGVEIIRNVAVGYEREGAHAYMRYNNVRIPRDHMLGEPGQGFIVAQTRLGGGRIHHATLGISTEMPFAAGVLDSYHMGLADGPTEVHKVTVARQALGGYQGTHEMFPDYHLIKRREAALAKYADVLEREVAEF